MEHGWSTTWRAVFQRTVNFHCNIEVTIQCTKGIAYRAVLRLARRLVLFMSYLISVYKQPKKRLVDPILELATSQPTKLSEVTELPPKLQVGSHRELKFKFRPGSLWNCDVSNVSHCRGRRVDTSQEPSNLCRQVLKYINACCFKHFQTRTDSFLLRLVYE